MYVHVYMYINTTSFCVRFIGEPLAPMLFCFRYAVSLSPPQILIRTNHSPAVSRSPKRIFTFSEQHFLFDEPFASKLIMVVGIGMLSSMDLEHHRCCSYEADAFDSIGNLRNPRPPDSQHRNIRTFRVPLLQHADTAFADRSAPWPPQGVQQGGASSSTTPLEGPTAPSDAPPPKGGPPPPPQPVWRGEEGVWRRAESETEDIEDITSNEEEPGIPEGALPVESAEPAGALALMNVPAPGSPDWSPVE